MAIIETLINFDIFICMTQKELLEAILFDEEEQIQDTKVLLYYALVRIDELEEQLDCMNEKIDELLLKI